MKSSQFFPLVLISSLLFVQCLANTNLINDICKKNKEVKFKFCVASFTSDRQSQKATTDDQLGEHSFQHVISKASTLASRYSFLVKKYPNQNIQDCSKIYSKATSTLEEALKSYKVKDYPTANIRVSAAMEDSADCSEGFQGENKDPLQRMNSAFIKLAKISLSFVRVGSPAVPKPGPNRISVASLAISKPVSKPTNISVASLSKPTNISVASRAISKPVPTNINVASLSKPTNISVTSLAVSKPVSKPTNISVASLAISKPVSNPTNKKSPLALGAIAVQNLILKGQEITSAISQLQKDPKTSPATQKALQYCLTSYSGFVKQLTEGLKGYQAKQCDRLQGTLGTLTLDAQYCVDEFSNQNLKFPLMKEHREFADLADAASASISFLNGV